MADKPKDKLTWEELESMFPQLEVIEIKPATKEVPPMPFGKVDLGWGRKRELPKA